MPTDDLFIGYDHVAYATRDTDATVQLLVELGFTLKIYKQKIEKFNVYVTKLVCGANAANVAEVVEPISSPSVVSRLLDGQESAVYHTCFRTNDFYRAQAKLRRAGAVTVTKPMKIPYPVTEAHREYLASHMHHPHLGLLGITGPVVEEAVGETRQH